MNISNLNILINDSEPAIVPDVYPKYLNETNTLEDFELLPPTLKLTDQKKDSPQRKHQTTIKKRQKLAKNH